MFRSLYFKIVMILVIMVFAVMGVVGVVLISSVSDFYRDEFSEQMAENFKEGTQLRDELTAALSDENYFTEQKSILASYGSMLGIDAYRNYYILDINGLMLEGSDASLGKSLIKTSNMIEAMKGGDSCVSTKVVEYSDAAFYLKSGERECIIYIKDSLNEVSRLQWSLISIIIQAIFIGLVIAILLAFFLAKAISSPIQNLTKGTQLVAEGDFSTTIEAHSNDEIGTLTENFNVMKNALKNTLDEVSGERAKLETVFSYLTDSVITFSEDGEILNINECGIRMFGEHYSESFNIYKMFDLLGVPFNGDKLELSGFGGKAESTDGGIVIHELVYNNRVFDVSFGVIKYLKDNELQEGFITIIHDITETYELDKSRREFVANVSHELRTPLTSIKGACETILEDDEMPEEIRRHFLSMVVTESDRMTRIVADLLVLSRLDNKRTRWRIEEFDCREAIRHLCEVMRVDAKARNHKLRFSASKYIPNIVGDREKIEQVIINIMSNAMKYTPDGGEINVLAKYSKNKPDIITVSVSDNGIGIPKEDVDHLFERFYRVEKSRTSETGGTGLGLAIAKEIIMAHGGDIKIESTYGKGTTMIIELPLVCELEGDE